jgi:hypothetical protein
VSSFQLLLGVGDKMLALGRTDDAERMLGPRLRDFLQRVRRNEPANPEAVRAALERALRLASLTGKGEWYAFIFDLARLQHRILDETMLDELHAHMLLHKPAQVAPSLQAYLDEQTGNEPAALRKRLEALLRFCR